MHHRYGNNSNSSTISSAGHGVFLGTAREKRDKLLRKAYLSQQRNGLSGGWQPQCPPSPPPPLPPSTINEPFSPEFRYFRQHQNSRTHSADTISSTTTNTTLPLTEHPIPRTSSQTSLNIHRASPCPSDISFSYSNPKYFVRTAVFRPASALNTRTPLHYENVLVSYYSIKIRSFVISILSLSLLTKIEIIIIGW
jgi:hypothetical protein